MKLMALARYALFRLVQVLHVCPGFTLRGQKLSSGDKNCPPGTKIVPRGHWSPPGKNTPLFSKIRTVRGYFLGCFLSPGGSPKTTFWTPDTPPENWVYLARYALFQHVEKSRICPVFGPRGQNLAPGDIFGPRPEIAPF